MKTKTAVTLLVMLTLAFAWSPGAEARAPGGPPAHAQGPPDHAQGPPERVPVGPPMDEVFAKTDERMAEILDLQAECLEHLQAVADRCGQEVRRLLEEGEVEAAQELACRCVEELNRIAEECIAEIRELCAEHIRWLRRFGHDELADSFRDRCLWLIEQIEDARDAHAAPFRLICAGEME